MTQLQEGGVANMNMRFRGWFNGGLDHTVPNNLTVERSIGGERGLAALVERGNTYGFETYFETDFNIVRRSGTFSGYNRLFHGPRSINNHEVLAQPLEMVSNKGYVWWLYYVVSPNRKPELVQNFARNVSRTGIEGLNLSVASAGTSLVADYSRNNPVNMHQTQLMTVDNMTHIAETLGNNILIDGGNAYALPFASGIMNMPLWASAHINAYRSVPFMQLVLHGFVPYAGPSLNMEADVELALLRNIEFGANPAFTVAYANMESLKGGAYSFFFSVDYHAWYEIILDTYQRFNAVFADLTGVPMERHDRLEEGVYMTSYANGTRVIVNYNREAVSVEVEGRAVNVGPRSFEAVRV